MGKIEKAVLPKHKETMSPWLKRYVKTASTTPLPLLPEYLSRFPTRWPFSRGDLYHWIPLLNRFDSVLEELCAVYGLNEGSQSRDFGCDLLLRYCSYADASQSKISLEDLQFQADGDRELAEAILRFTRMLLEHCGNRSIYASSALLNDLLNTSSLSLLARTLEVGSELAQRYQASVKRIGTPSRQISSALLANHYNIDLDRVYQLASPFLKTRLLSATDSIAPTTPASASKAKEKIQSTGRKSNVVTHANDLVAVACSSDQDWAGWANIQVFYYPTSPDGSGPDYQVAQPSSPTPIRRSSSFNAQNHSPRARQTQQDDSSPTHSRTRTPEEDSSNPCQKTFELPQSLVLTSPTSILMNKCPADMPSATRYEVFHRLRVAKSLNKDQASRQSLLTVRLLAATNLAYVYNESLFIEKVLRPDIEETRRYHLIQQLADLIHPSEGDREVPVRLQTIALALLEAISSFPNKTHEVLSAVNANVNHGVLHYVIRKAVSSMRDELSEEAGDHATEADDWRNNLFSLTLHLAMTSRVGNEMVAAGLIDVLVDMLKIRSSVAQRHHSMVLAFLDSLIWTYQTAFTAFFSADGVDAVASLAVDTVKEAQALVASGKGIGPDYQSISVDYQLPFYQQQTLKWVTKYVHRLMSSSVVSYGGNADRLLRNLAEKSDLLAALRQIIRDKRTFGSVIWTSTVTILADFINNDPTSFAAIFESGMITTYLEAITCRRVPDNAAANASKDAIQEGENPGSPDSSIESLVEQDQKAHPPADEDIAQTKREYLASGILPSSDAISVVPMVLNSISLNHQGMRMVVASKALESFLEIFESPRHVKLMATDSHLAGNVGSGLDELARHHPALRTSISNAVIDVVARIRYLGRQKYSKDAWGARLLVTSPNGDILSVTDAGDLQVDKQDVEAKNRIKHNTPADSDVEMEDALPEDSNAQQASPKQSNEMSPSESFTPYVTALASFLSPYMLNSVLKINFIDHGGIETLLDICQSPALSANFSESFHSRNLSLVVTQLIENSPVRGLPSLLHRTQDAISLLEPLSTRTDSTSAYFAPFLPETLDLDQITPEAQLVVRNGTRMVKSLLDAQILLKILADCFVTSRSYSTQFYPVNVYDYYFRLLKSLGPLLKGVLAEEAAQLALVPDSWSAKRSSRTLSDDLQKTEDESNANNHTLPVHTNEDHSWAALGDEIDDGLIPSSAQERTTTRFRNYKVLRQLLHPFVPTAFPFFQSLGKALLPRREPIPADHYSRYRHLQLAEALAETILNQLRDSVSKPDVDTKRFQYWIILLHSIHEMVIDHPSGRPSERPAVHVIMPVLLAFNHQNGFQVLDKMVASFISAIEQDIGSSSGASSTSKVASFGLKKILDLYLILSNGKHITDSCSRFALQRDRAAPNTPVHQQVVLEIRAAIVPSLDRVWNSALLEKLMDSSVKQIVNILKLVATADNEMSAIDRDKSPFYLFPPSRVTFNWVGGARVTNDIVDRDYDKNLATEAAYRSHCNSIMAREYCRAHKASLAGPRNPIPDEDADTTMQAQAGRQGLDPVTSESDNMSIDQSAEGSSVADLVQNGGSTSTAASKGRETSAAAQTAGEHTRDEVTKTAIKNSLSQGKDQLEQFRSRLRTNLIAQSLDVIRTHPEAAMEVCDLINAVVLVAGRPDEQDEVLSTLINALSSLLMNEDEREQNGKPIAAYAHLLALVLQHDKLFDRNLDELREKVGEMVQLLSFPQILSNTELPPWIPFILLLLEMFLCHDARPIPAAWKQPTSLDEECESPIIQTRDPLISTAQKQNMLDLLMDLLPRIGKEEVLATSILRILVIISRHHDVAKRIGEKKNLQRLFLIAKQLSGSGSERLKQTKLTAYVNTILRHIIEDDEVIKQGMRAEIRGSFPTIERQSGFVTDVAAYLRAMSPVALRSPELFVTVSNELLEIPRWYAHDSTDTSRSSQPVALKDTSSNEDEKAKSDADQGVHASVKESTEPKANEMESLAKQHTDQKKTPIVEHPDGVIHFLLSELLNYKDVEDKEPTANCESNNDRDGKTTQSAEPSSDSGADAKDKKQVKPTFKADEHPIFIYRCFLLNTLTELLQSYNRSKVEFINFKRNAPPLSTVTPVKPRSTVLNYLIDSLLCQGNLVGTVDSIVAKKKAATATHVHKLFTALVSRTRETHVDRTLDKYDYDQDADLLFVRKFVLDTILRAYERSAMPNESMETRYSRLQSLAELMIHMAGERDKDSGTTNRHQDSSQARSQAQLRRLMYEKGFLDKMTASIADISLGYPHVKRAIKYILRVLRLLTDTAKDLRLSGTMAADPSSDIPDDESLSSSSLSDINDDDREETPDLYRNSALGMLEPRGEDDESEDEEDDDEDLYGDEYEDDEMDYGEEEISDEDENISDEEEEGLSEMGEIEGLHGEPGMVEVIMDEDEEDSTDDSDEDISHDDSEDDDDEDDDVDSADIEDMEDQIEIFDEDGNPIQDDGASGWASESLGSNGNEGPQGDADVQIHAHDEVEHHFHEIGPGALLDNMARAIISGEDDFNVNEFIEDAQDDEDEGDEEDDLDDDEYMYDDGYPLDDELPPMPSSAGWDEIESEDHDRRHVYLVDHGHRRPVLARMDRDGIFPSRFSGGRDLLDFRSYISRNSRNANNQAQNGDGVNPLLRRLDSDQLDSNRHTLQPRQVNLRLSDRMMAGRGPDGHMAFLGDLMEILPNVSGRHGQGFQFHITGPGAPRDMRDWSFMRSSRHDGRREGAAQEPHHAVLFAAESTLDRYQEEARMVFGSNDHQEAMKLSNIITALLTPAAMEAERQRQRQKQLREEEQRKKMLDEKKEEEERLAREREAAQKAKEQAEQEAQSQDAQTIIPADAELDASGPQTLRSHGNDDGDDASMRSMQGVETANEASALPATADPTASEPRTMTRIRGEDVDVTELGIDPEYLAALPEEFREEVIAQTISERRSQAREEAASGENTEVFQEFLDALPDELRLEIQQQERAEQRRRVRSENRRAAAQTGIPDAMAAADMDLASILLTFPPELREQVLIDQGDDFVDQLPPDMAAQARALSAQQPPQPNASRGNIANISTLPNRERSQNPGDGGNGPPSQRRPQRRPIVQMLDKAGIATLLRLMFIAQHGSIRTYLFSVFADVCGNRQNRLEVISSVLQILQEGSTDMLAVERSFGQLSLKAKRPKDKEGEPKTPQAVKRSLTSTSGVSLTAAHSETSPVLVLQQCLDLLVDLSTRNLHVPWLFLAEHEIFGPHFKKTLSRKGKTKEKDSKAAKFAINSLLTLLDRDLVMESPVIMSHLADLLNRVTLPLGTLERRRKEAEKDMKLPMASESGSAGQGTGDAAAAAASENNTNVIDGQSPKDKESSQVTGDQGTDRTTDVSNKEAAARKLKQVQPPFIPARNLNLVVRIFLARECSSKTFQNTISTIKNLSAIPGAKETFGQELVAQARRISENIVQELDNLLPHIEKAKSGTEVQGVALARFSPGASEQNKLLRVLTALDHLFENRKKEEESETSSNTMKLDDQDLVNSLYHNSTFSSMWSQLGACLRAIRERENMLNIATILLPLIESLMVVCKNATVNEDLSQSQYGKDMVLSSPPPENRAATLFITFTEEHRRILNELVRNNPKLMSGTFSLLVKNPKVLEFDNKRNYFNRSVHSRSGHSQRPNYSPLQISVRREFVFHDSYKHLYFKSGDEMKFGKLNIRFNGEEGVDAGGVTREWFQVLARQMFDPNYVLFIPVSSDRTTFHPNKLSGINDEHLSFFKFIGRIIGKALYEGRLLDCYFSRAVYKRILGRSVSVKDMESFDPEYFKSLDWMLHNDITDVIVETFSVEDDEFGVTTVVDLVPNGRDIPVTEENKSEYVRLVVEHKLLSSVKEQMSYFLKGFREIIPAELISIFDEQELELLISGLPEIDIDDWKANSEYHNYNPGSQQVQWFWRAVRSFDKEERAKLLQFVTGTSKVPLNGFKELEGMNGVNRFNIHRDYGDKDRLPSSHTCFNQLDLPEYESYDALRGQLMKAITQGSEGFGFA